MCRFAIEESSLCLEVTLCPSCAVASNQEQAQDGFNSALRSTTLGAACQVYLVFCRPCGLCQAVFIHSIRNQGPAEIFTVRKEFPLSPGRPAPVSVSNPAGIQMTNQQQPPDPLRDYGQPAVRRREIEEDPILKLFLQDWDDEKKQMLLSVESYRGRCNAAKAELYQLMGFYSVFQGVVFTAVSTASKLTCETSFFPAVLSGLASIATIVSVHYKLDYYTIEKVKFLKAQHQSGNIINKVRKLRGNGASFNFASLGDPEVTTRKTPCHQEENK
ncbi:hypothetical protein M758_2G037900 [Ceratodon purpureus]|nr:hypothetical protein M758_2G037900 [Ceratodon purpureus]